MPEAESSDRLPLDTLVSRMRDPTFVARHRRRVSLRETSAKTGQGVEAAFITLAQRTEGSS